MVIAELTLDSQAVHAEDGVDDLSTTGKLWSGDYEFATNAIIAASAMRFELPDLFNGYETIVSAILNLRVRTGVPQTSAGYGDHRSRIRILASTSQVLPATGAAVSSASGGTEQVTIGQGTYSPVLDYEVTTSFTDEAIDITDVMAEAVTAGRLASGWMVVLIQPIDYDDANHLEANGIGETAPATIDLEYLEGSPPLEEILVDLDYTLDDVSLLANLAWGPVGELADTLDDVTLAATAEIAERFITLDVTLDDVTLAATVSSVVEANLATTLDDVTLASSVVMFAQASLAVTLDNVSLDAYVTQVAVIAIELVVTLDDVVLESAASTSGGAFLSVTLDNVVLVSELIGPRVGRVGLFADGGLFAAGGFLV